MPEAGGGGKWLAGGGMGGGIAALTPWVLRERPSLSLQGEEKAVVYR